MTFWIVAVALTLAVTALLVLALLRGRDAARNGGGDAERADIGIYRDQLAAVERDLARGTVTEDEADRLRLEIKRRILDADRANAGEPPVRPAPRGLTTAAAALSLVGVLGGSVWLYGTIGAPSYPDLPLAARLEAAAEARETRPRQAQAEAETPPLPPSDAPAEFMDLMERLRAAVRERPGDLQGQQLLARNEANLGNFAAAHAAMARVIEIKGPSATAQDYADYGDLLVLAAGGYVSPEAEAAFAEALERDPQNGVAQYYIGQMHLQTGRPDIALRIWDGLLRASAPQDPWVAPIRQQIETAARRAGVDYSIPAVEAPAPGGAPALPGPDADAVAAAEDMSPAERMEMIEGMVAGLGERLASDGGSPDEWARLIRALGVLGRTDQAAAIWAEAQQVFPDDINRVPILRAARDAGVAQ